ncbi:fluoride efflux transporter CrcB [Streptomyces montanisoli]|uniref:Fluoride-specific ion channel FluC n=1 Tax=Streptomyces montanisoli TaxID=2798581 RepID=A0A940MB03_9ACTN|nr:fluoride efflux transporter CrcB [Streptomyces montanisoli]MBP0457151.1 fluoride efflux transporter CrcB [Streptomyces montanisoli]
MPSQRTGPPASAEPIDPDTGLSASPRRREPRLPHYTVLGVIAVGGALGAVARYGASRLWPAGTDGFPWATLTVNAVGCLVIGVFLVVVSEVFSAHRLLRPFFATGVLGGFTTFSTYCVDIVRLVDSGRAGPALAYLAATLVAAMAAVSAGAWSTRRVVAKWGER